MSDKITVYRIGMDWTVRKVRIPAPIHGVLHLDAMRDQIDADTIDRLNIAQGLSAYIDDNGKITGKGPNLLAGLLCSMCLQPDRDGNMPSVLCPGDYLAGDVLLVVEDHGNEPCEPNARLTAAGNTNYADFIDGLIKITAEKCREEFFSRCFGTAYTEGLRILLASIASVRAERAARETRDQNGMPVPPEVMEMILDAGIDPDDANFFELCEDDAERLADAMESGKSQEEIDKILAEAKRNCQRRNN